MNLKQIMNMDVDALEKLTEKELRKVLNSLVSIANKRIRRIEANKEGLGRVSIPLNIRRNSKGKVRLFTSKLPKSKYHRKYKTPEKQAEQTAMRVEETLNRISSLKGFLKAKGSTYEGVKEISEKIIKDFDLADDYGKLSDRQKTRFWEAYHKFQKDHWEFFNKRNDPRYDKLRENFFNFMVKYKTKTDKIRLRRDLDEVFKDMLNDLVSDYEKGEREREDDSPLSTTTARSEPKMGIDEEPIVETISIYK